MIPASRKTTSSESIAARPLSGNAGSISPSRPAGGATPPALNTHDIFVPVPADRYGELHTVESPRRRGLGMRARLTLLGVLAAGDVWRRGFAPATVLNFGKLLTPEGTFALDRQPVLFLMGGHVENPVDSELILAQWRNTPWVGHGKDARILAPNVTKRVHENWDEHVSGYLFQDLVVQVDTRKGGTEEEIAARRARNHAVLGQKADEVMAGAEQMLIYTEGTTTGDGRIANRKTGGLEEFLKHADKPVALVLATHTYEPLTHPRIQPFINVRKTVVRLAPDVDRRDLAQALDIEQSRLRVVTGTGLVGAYLQHARDHRKETFTCAELEGVIADIATRLEAEKASSGLDIEIDPQLLDRAAIAAGVKRAFHAMCTQVFDRDRSDTYFAPTEDADVFRLTKALRPRVDLDVAAPKEDEIPSKLERRDPVGFWGTAAEQHMRHQPRFLAIARSVFNEHLAKA